MDGIVMKEKKKFINLLFRRDISRSGVYSSCKGSEEIQNGHESIKSPFAKYHEKTLSREELEGFRNRGFSYLGVFGGTSNYSKAIDIKRYNEGKVGRPRKYKSDNKFCNSKKQRKKELKRATISATDCPNTGDGISSLPPSTSVNEALDIIERRRKSIKAKLSAKKEHLLTQEEEQDIHTRADIYAITTAPDPHFYTHSDEDQTPCPPVNTQESDTNLGYPTAKKKRRRNYGNSNCFVSYHNNEDLFDNTKMLPIGTKLIKPPTKLVELVAQAVDGSPDGLLQVQQIYTFLQNRYPFFRYMERSSINSWRSSIRHALYQKWFRKIRFDLTYINSKGCYWAINHKTNPKEWTMPESTGSVWLNTEKTQINQLLQELSDLDEDCFPLGGLDMDTLTHTDILTLLREEKTDGDSTEGVLAVAREFGIELDEPDTANDEEMQSESPVRESDPCLATCAPIILNDDLYISSPDSSCKGRCSSPLVGSPLYLQSPSSALSPGCDHYSTNTDDGFYSPAPSKYGRFWQHRVGRKSQPTHKPSVMSPVVSWTPNWDEYGSYILSPQSVSSQCFGVQIGGKSQDQMSIPSGRQHSQQSHTTCLSVIDDVNFILANSPNFSNSASETGSEVEVIAEFPKVCSDVSEENEDFDFIDV